MNSIPAQHHPLLRPAAFITRLPRPLGDLEPPGWLAESLYADAPSPFDPHDAVRVAVRNALRTHGYKPTGRGKPAAEYLTRAAAEGGLTSINLAVDACNAVSLHSGFPISVIDLDRATGTLRIEVAGADAAYVFNPSGQEIRVGGLPCLVDAHGPCANAVKDAQRTKTGPETTRTLSVLWGCAPFEDRADRAVAWYREILDRAGATTRVVPIEGPPPA